MIKHSVALLSMLVVILSLILAIPVLSIEPPRAGEIEQYRKDGSLAERIEFAKSLKNYKVHSSLIQRKIAEIRAIQKGERFIPRAFPYETGLPSHGEPKIFAILIEFPDHEHTNEKTIFVEKIFGDGEQEEFPYESLKEYYERSSYNALSIQGGEADILGWYTAQHNRDYYGASDYSGVKELIKEAIDYYDTTHDFSQYDNNDDGRIDYFCVLWTGPDTGWDSIWWAWCDMDGDIFESDSYTVDHKQLGIFSWQWEANPPGTEFNPHTVIHETGHALGLPDYYDYDDSVGPGGGVGGLDMMDGNWGDHNAFSKWLLDWVTPTIIGDINNIHTITFRPSSQYADCVAIMPAQTLSEYFAEYFIVQNRSQLSNDSDIPTNGLLIWHVDARLNDSETDFKYDNSSTEHKLLRLMEADGLEEIETGDGHADAGDFYTPGNVFSPYPEAIPNSTDYAENYTGVSVLDITEDDSTMTAALYNFASVQIINPTQSNPANAGLRDNPTEIDIEIQVDTYVDIHLGKDDFDVQIGGKPAMIVSSIELPDKYVLTVMPPTQDTSGLYNLTVSLSDFSDTETDVIRYSEPADWSFMIYLGGDNNLESFGVDDINEMETIGSTDDVKVIVLFDRPGTDTVIYEITQDSTSNIVSQVKKDYGENKNSGDPDLLEDFITWTVQNYPAQRYCLDMWNHGSAWKKVPSTVSKGIVYDDTSGDHLTMIELKNALNSVGTHFDVIGFDACLMGAVEVDYQLKDYADYIVGSEEEEPGDGWPYDIILQDLVNTPTISGETLAETIVTKYGDYYQSEIMPTMAAVRTSSLSGLITAVDTFSQELTDSLPTSRPEIETVRDNVEWYTSDPDPGAAYLHDIFIDLYHFAELIKQSISDQDVKNSADSVMTNLGNAVVAEWHGSGHPNSNGMTIYFTKQDDPDRTYDSVYETLDFSARTRWNEFLKMYLAELSIVSPTQSNPANAGLKDDPRKIDVELQIRVTPQIIIHGLSGYDFNVRIGGKSATVLNVTELSDTYLLEVLPPTQDSYGRYDLMVSMNWLLDTETTAVIYSEGTNVDTVLVLDRSGSMDFSGYIEPAKNAAKQFVDFMNEGDKIGVVSFSDYATVNYPLTLITPSSPGEVVFSDDIESGYGNWMPDPPWDQITFDSHSPITCWTDSPGGDYSDYVDTSLTSIDISIPADGNAFLSFWHHYEIESGYDYGKVQVSTDGGSSWLTLTSYTGSQYDWVQTVVDLTSYVGQTIEIRFRLTSDYSVTYDGWYIDDVEIKTGVSDVKEWAKQTIDSIYAGGATSIGDGLQDSREQLVSYGDPDHAWATILLSDGYENEPPWVADVLPTIPDKIDVYTIALGADSDEALLQTIATETGGQYYFSPTAQELQGIYNLIRGGVVGEETIVSTSDTVSEGESKVETAQVDSTVTRATFGISWSGSDLDLTLTDPDGNLITPDVAATNPNIEFVSTSTYEYYLITSPLPGEWGLVIRGVSTPPGGEEYTATVTAQANLTLRAYFDKDQYETAQPITVLVALSDPLGPIRGAGIEVDVQAPQQTLSAWKSIGGVKGDKSPTVPLRKPLSVLKSSRSLDDFQLYDDGTHGDGQANDGIYGNIYADTSNSGSYIFNFEASGLTNDGYPFTRISQRSVFVSEPQSAGSISGTISYSGTQQGTIYIQAWQDDSAMHGNPDYLTSISSPDSYTLSNLPDGSFYLSYYMDVNGNDNQDVGEPSGIYGRPGTPNPVEISSGNSVSGIDINLLSSPSSLIGFSDDGSITIAWSSSPTPDVAGNKVYYGTASGSYSNVVDAGDGIYHEITGLDNSLTYFVALTSYDSQGNESMYSEEISLSPGAEAVELHTGWNLIALPRLPLSVYLAGGPTDNLFSILSSISGKFNSIWAYNASTGEWLRYDIHGPEFLNNLTGVVQNEGYWIDMEEDAVLEVGGAIIKTADLDLKTGWNLAGYSLEDAQSINDVLSYFSEGKLVSIWTYDASTGDWLRYDITGPEFLNNLTELESGKGYWAYALQDFVMHLEVPSASSAPTSVSQLPLVVKDIKVPPVQLPPSTIYGTVERNGEVLTKKDNCLVSLKFQGNTLASYTIGSNEKYGNFYVLQIPIYLTDVGVEKGTGMEILINGRKVSEIGISKSGETERFDISYIEIPKFSALLQNYPNPFNPDTWIPYQLRKDANVTIKIYNLSGELVRTLNMGYKEAGYYTTKTKSAYWDGRNEIGEPVSSGIYFYEIKAGEFQAIRKMAVLK